MANIIKSILNSRRHDIYGTIYYPPYNVRDEISKETPDIYNAAGRPMDVFFIRDRHFAHSPYGQRSRYFLWDRYNFGLDTHFYTGLSMLETMGRPSRKYGWLAESEAIDPASYDVFDKNKGLEKDFDLIFTYSDRILNRLGNARFYPCLASPWYGTSIYGGTLDPRGYEKKNKNVSLLAAKKNKSSLHAKRTALAVRLKRSGAADTYGTFDGGAYLDDLSAVYSRYRYTFAFENDIKPYYFTERLTNCFASMTVPIYLGASKISEFFNADGIIEMTSEDLENPEKLLSQCSAKDYESRLPAVMDNYGRVQEYLNMEDWLYEKYFMGKK